MRQDYEEIFAAAARLGSSRSISQVFTRFSKELEQLGFSSYLVTDLPGQETVGWQNQILRNHWPEGWYHRYLEAGHYRFDPCVAASRERTAPFVWGDIFLPGMNSAGRQVMDEAREFGLKEGICIPILRPHASPSVVTMAGQEADVSPSGRRRAHALARQMYRTATRFSTGKPTSDAPRQITEREREMLKWMADGKTAWEISRILGISQHTVITHQRNLRLKLNAANNAHSVAEAMRRHEIQV